MVPYRTPTCTKVSTLQAKVEKAAKKQKKRPKGQKGQAKTKTEPKPTDDDNNSFISLVLLAAAASASASAERTRTLQIIITMISNFFVLSPRGDTVIAKTYRSKSGVRAHERSHTEAFFRKVKFWDGVAPGTPGMDTTLGLGSGKISSSTEGGGGGEGAETSKESVKRFGDAPPVFVMPDGYSYLHVKRNGLIFGCATEKNVSPVVVIEVSAESSFL